MQAISKLHNINNLNISNLNINKNKDSFIHNNLDNNNAKIHNTIINNSNYNNSNKYNTNIFSMNRTISKTYNITYSSPINVAFLYSSLFGNGIARFLIVTGEYLVRKGYNVVFSSILSA